MNLSDPRNKRAVLVESPQTKSVRFSYSYNASQAKVQPSEDLYLKVMFDG